MQQLSTDSGLASEVVAAEAQDASTNVTEKDQEAVNATTTTAAATTAAATTAAATTAGTTQSLHEKDETTKEEGKSEPKLLKVRATVEEEEKKSQNETVKDDAADRHPKELKPQKDSKPETTTAEPETTKAP